MRNYLRELWKATKKSILDAPRFFLYTIVIYAFLTIIMQFAQLLAVQECLEWRVPQAAIGPGFEIYCVTQVNGTVYARPLDQMNMEWQLYGGE